MRDSDTKVKLLLMRNDSVFNNQHFVHIQTSEAVILHAESPHCHRAV